MMPNASSQPVILCLFNCPNRIKSNFIRKASIAGLLLHDSLVQARPAGTQRKPLCSPATKSISLIGDLSTRLALTQMKDNPARQNKEAVSMHSAVLHSFPCLSAHCLPLVCSPTFHCDSAAKSSMLSFQTPSFPGDLLKRLRLKRMNVLFLFSFAGRHQYRHS